MKNKITARQLLVICFTAVLSPIIRVVPGSSIGEAGKAAWLCPILAIIPLTLTAWIIQAGLKEVPGEGLGGLFQRAFGTVAGKILCAVEAVWIVFVLSVDLRLYGERFLGTIYRNASMLFFILTLAGLSLWLVSSSLPAFARMAQMCFFAVTITVGVILILSFKSVRPGNVLPVWWEDFPRAAVGVVPVLRVLSLGFLGYFLYGEVEHTGGKELSERWIVSLCLTVTVVSFVAQGVFGTGLSQRLQMSFFSLAKNIKLGSAVERVEALVVAEWVLSDMILLLLLLKGFQRITGDLLSSEGTVELCYPVVFLMVVGAMLCASEINQAEKLSNRVAEPAGLVLLYLIPIVAAIVVKIKGRKNRKNSKKGVDKGLTK